MHRGDAAGFGHWYNHVHLYACKPDERDRVQHTTSATATQGTDRLTAYFCHSPHSVCDQYKDTRNVRVISTRFRLLSTNLLSPFNQPALQSRSTRRGPAKMQTNISPTVAQAREKPRGKQEQRKQSARHNGKRSPNTQARLTSPKGTWRAIFFASRTPIATRAA